MSGQTIGPYTITRGIGRGGMGEVFEAQAGDGRRVAVKTLSMPETPDPAARWEAIERFQREARAARSLQHPNIVSVLDVGEDQGRFYIVMEYLDGQSVHDLLEMAGAISVERAKGIIVRVCDALAYAHERQVIHRDIKPHNIMILRDGRAKLTDFGLAAITAETGLTATGTVMGTFCYMSPEQARGQKVDTRSDIFSLGATFYEMISGRRAFAGDTPGAIVASILNDEPPAIPGAPPEVQRVISRCLRKEPEKRFQSAREILAGLSAGATVVDAGAHLTTSAPPEDPTGRESKPGGKPVSTEVRRQLHVDITCPRCHERWVAGRGTCWKCGAPDPRRTPSRLEQSAQDAILEAVKKMAPRRKKWWQVWR